MALDGFTVASIVRELKHTIENGRISKIGLPVNVELLLTVKGSEGHKRLLLSGSASLPLAYLTSQNKPSPMTAPNFCMLLRKHIGGGRIVSVTQPGLERIISFEIEHLNDMGDLCRKFLIIELMGKHSNIIFCDDENKILDSIKHVSAQMSSVREVLPGRTYFIPETQHKRNPVQLSREDFMAGVFSRPMPLSKAIYSTLTGFSPCMAEELCFRASLEPTQSALEFGENEQLHLYGVFSRLMEDTENGSFSPCIVYDKDDPVEYAAFHLEQYADMRIVPVESISALLEQYYAEKNTITRIRQKSADLRHLVQTALDRSRKKYDLQLKQLKDTEKRDKYRIYGELLNTYGYSAAPGARSLEALNYYTNEMITIPLDETLTATENAKKYFDRYGKLKRTYEALTTLTQETKDTIDHLESILTALNIALAEEDLVQIREELAESGYIRRKGGQKKVKITSRPFHYLSSDGFHIYVGKNNLQNDTLTFKFASGGDWWFHAKGIPGSHVVVKTEGKPLPDRTFEEAAALAAYYSGARGSEKAEVDYIEKKHVKKPAGARPGFVVYYTNYSMSIGTDISGIQLLES